MSAGDWTLAPYLDVWTSTPAGFWRRSIDVHDTGSTLWNFAGNYLQALDSKALN